MSAPKIMWGNHDAFEGVGVLLTADYRDEIDDTQFLVLPLVNGTVAPEVRERIMKALRAAAAGANFDDCLAHALSALLPEVR